MILNHTGQAEFLGWCFLHSTYGSWGGLVFQVGNWKFKSGVLFCIFIQIKNLMLVVIWRGKSRKVKPGSRSSPNLEANLILAFPLIPPWSSLLYHLGVAVFRGKFRFPLLDFYLGTRMTCWSMSARGEPEWQGECVLRGIRWTLKWLLRPLKKSIDGLDLASMGVWTVSVTCSDIWLSSDG